MNPPLEYRPAFFENYGSRMQGAGPTFNRPVADQWGRAVEVYLRDWLPQDRGARILEIACGRGWLLHFFKQRGYTDLTGIDISSEQVRLSRAITDNVHEADALGFLGDQLQQGHQYDLVVGFDIIEHLHKDEALQFLRRCRRLLAPGGRLILKTPNAESPWGLTYRYGDMTHEICFNPTLLTKVLTLSGFSDIEARENGPVVLGARSLTRYVVWRSIRAGLSLWNIAETGEPGSGVYTRNFLITGTV